MFFQILSTIKAKLVDEVMQSGYLCVILRATHKKYHFRGLNLISYSWQSRRWRPRWRPLLLTSQGSSSATTHKYTSLRRSKAFYWRQKCFEIPQHVKKLWGEVPSTLIPLVLRWGYEFVCTSWGSISIGWAWSWGQTFHLQLILIYTEINIFLNLGPNFHWITVKRQKL